MRKPFFICMAIGFLSTTPGCGGNETLVGVWEVLYQDAVGQVYFDVLELTEDGNYTVHASSGADDRGQYRQLDDVIEFRSSVDARFSRTESYRFLGSNTLEFGSGVLGVPTEWTRSSSAPAFGTVERDGKYLPVEVSRVLSETLENIALPWRDDAVPTRVETKALRHGHQQLIMYFFSPSSQQQLRVGLSAYWAATSVSDGSRARTRPLDSYSLDLIEAFDAALASGIAGTFRSASLESYANRGSVWFITTTGPVGAYIGAETGERIRGDITGYIEDYEADWSYAQALWEEVRRQLSQAGRSRSSDDNWWDNGYEGSYQQCKNLGGLWDAKPGAEHGGDCL